MNALLKRAVAAGLAAGCLGANGWSAFQTEAPSVTAEGLGGAFAAKADEASAIFVNPAGLGQLKRGEASFSYASLYAGIPGLAFTQSALAASRPLGGRGSVALGASSFDADGKLSEQEGLLGGSFRVGEHLYAGGNVTYLKHAYGIGNDPRAQIDPLFKQGTSKAAVGFDAGLLATAGMFRLGLSGRNLNKPDLGIATEDRVPMEVRGGVGVKLKDVEVLGELKRRDAGEASRGKKNFFGAGGIPWSPLALLTFRAGLGTDRITGGMGLNFGKDFRLDYAFGLSQTVQDNAGLHRLAVTWRFGEDVAGAESAASARPAEAAPASSRAYGHAPLQKGAPKKRWVD